MIPLYLYNTVKNYTKGDRQKGEKQVPQLTWTGIKPATFSGPGTKMQRQFSPKSQAKYFPGQKLLEHKSVSTQDKAAKAHDLRYYFANNKDDISKADSKMSSKLFKTFSVNNWIGALGIKAKQVGDKLGITKTENFTTFGDYKSEKNPEKNEYLRKNLVDLEKEGYGFVQSVIFNKRKFTLAQAKAWLKHHGFKGKAVDEKPATFRFRQREPEKSAKYYTHKTKNKGVKLVIMAKKRSNEKEMDKRGAGRWSDFLTDANKIFDTVKEKVINPISKVPVIGNVIQAGFQTVKMPFNAIKLVTQPNKKNFSDVFNDAKSIIQLNGK